MVWYPIYNIHVNHLETLQRKYLKFMSYLIDGAYPPRGFDHTVLLARFNLTTLHTRRVVSVLRFLYNLVHFRIDCPYLLHKLNFLVPRLNSRNSNIFYCISKRTNVLVRSPVALMSDIANNINCVCDIYSNSIATISKAVVSFIEA